jgi:hypothetical protein
MDAKFDLIVGSMIERYGDDAAFYASRRAAVLEECGDRQTARSWDLICRAIKELAPAPERRVPILPMNQDSAGSAANKELALEEVC